jgi:hypothetical protein
VNYTRIQIILPAKKWTPLQGLTGCAGNEAIPHPGHLAFPDNIQNIPTVLTGPSFHVFFCDVGDKTYHTAYAAAVTAQFYTLSCDKRQR